MNNELQFCFIKHGSEAYKQALELRRKILRRPLGLDYSPEQLESEKECEFIVAYLQNKLVACLLIMPINSACARIRHVAVDEGLQGKGIGQALMGFTENYLKQNGFAQIVLHARSSALSFYEKLNYQKIDEPFMEYTIMHQKMLKNL